MSETLLAATSKAGPQGRREMTLARGQDGRLVLRLALEVRLDNLAAVRRMLAKMEEAHG